MKRGLLYDIIIKNVFRGNFMDAGKLWILNDLIATKRVCFKIPVYQRNYDWSETNCNRLLDEIKTIIDTEDKPIACCLKLILLYNAPLEYADLILNGDPEMYLKTITEYKPLDS